MRVTLFASLSYHAPATGILSRDYKFKHGKWTEVANGHDLSYLLGQSNCILREETPLGNKFVKCVSEKPRTKVRIDDGQVELREIYQSGQTYQVSTHLFRLLNKRDDFQEMPLADALTQQPTARVLIIRAGGLGDVLMSTPAVRTLAKQFPEARIWYCTAGHHRRIFQGAPFVERAVETLEAYEHAPFDFTVDLNWWVESTPLQTDMHRPDLFAHRLGVQCDDYRMHYQVADPDRAAARALLPDGGPLVAVQVRGATWDRTPSPGRILQITDAMKARGMVPVCVDNERDPFWDRPGYVNLTGKNNLPVLFGVLDQVDAVLAGDSGVTHAANALNKPTVALFGPVNPGLRIVGQPNCVVLAGNQYCNCAPCNDQQLKQCTPPPKCLDSIPVDLIVGKLAEMVGC